MPNHCRFLFEGHAKPLPIFVGGGTQNTADLFLKGMPNHCRFFWRGGNQNTADFVSKDKQNHCRFFSRGLSQTAAEIMGGPYTAKKCSEFGAESLADFFRRFCFMPKHCRFFV